MQLKRWISALALCVGLVACSEGKEEADEASAYNFASEPAPVGRSVANMPDVTFSANKSTSGEAEQQYLAFTHNAEFRVDADALEEAFERVQAWCLEANAFHCQIMDSSVQTDHYYYGRLQMRLLPSGVDPVLTMVGEHAELISRSTSAEDLGAAIVDTDKRLAMLKDYRAKLERLDARSDNTIDALVKIASELSRVQADIEHSEGRRARLMQRVNTDTLTISFSAEAHSPILEPIGNALKNFGHSSSSAFAGLITTVAYILPWLLVMIAVVWVLRRLWRRRK